MTALQISLFGLIVAVKNFSPEQAVVYAIGQMLFIYWLPDLFGFARRSGVLVFLMFVLGMLQVSAGVPDGSRQIMRKGRAARGPGR